MSLRKMREWRDCRDPRLPAAARQVLFALLTYADQDGRGARPSVQRLAADCGRCVRGVQQALACLRALGALEVERAAGRYTPTVYTVLSPAAWVQRRAPMPVESGRVMGAAGDVSWVQPASPDQVKRSGNKQTAAPRTALDTLSHKGQRPEQPTVDQVTKLVHVLLDDGGLPFTERDALVDLVKTACGRAGFLYDRRVVEAGICRALAGRGCDPESQDLSAARRRRHA